MSQEANDLHPRISVPELNQLLSNASAICHQSSNNSITGNIFELRKRFQLSGMEGFKDLPTSRRIHPRRTPVPVMNIILSLSMEHPSWGCVRLSAMLKSQGIAVSSPTIQKILIKNNMGNKNERLWKLEEGILAGVIQPSDEQLAKIENFNPCFRERLNTSCRPAEILAQDTMLVGSLNGIGKIYLQSVIDIYNSFTFGFLHPGKLPDCAVAVLHNDVLPFYRQYNLQIKTIVTNNGRQYCGTEKHHYELYLMLNEIKHQKAELHDALINGFTERFHRIALDEFFKKIFQNKTYNSLETLQSDFEQWLFHYNHERPHHGYRNMGKTPYEVYQNYFNNLTL
jgi:transposase InsO family protein